MFRKQTLAAMLAALVLFPLSGCSRPAAVTTEYDDNAVGNTPFNIMCGGELAVQGDTVYYYEPASVWNYGGGLFSVTLDGTGKKRLAKGAVESVNTAGDAVYFVRLHSGSKLGTLCSVSADGGGEQKIAEGCREALVLGETAYYIGTEDHLFSLDLAAGQPEELVSEPVLDYSVDGDSVYYRTAGGVWRKDGGSSPVCLLQGAVNAFSEQGGMAYCSVFDAASGANDITMLDESGNKSGFSFKGSRVTRIAPYRNALFLCTEDGGLIRVKPDGTAPVLYTGGHAVEPCFFADRAFAWSREKPVALLDDADVDFETMDVYADPGSIEENCKAVGIASADELSDAIDRYSLNSASGESLTDKYDDSFFEKKALILALVRVQTDSGWSVTGVAFSGVRTMKDAGNVLNVAVDAAEAGEGDDSDCGGCLVEIPKNDLADADHVGIAVNNVSDSLSDAVG